MQERLNIIGYIWPKICPSKISAKLQFKMQNEVRHLYQTYLLSRSAKDSSRKEYLFMPTTSGLANHGSITKIGYTLADDVHASINDGLSCNRKPFLNQCIAAVCFLPDDMVKEKE